MGDIYLDVYIYIYIHSCNSEKERKKNIHGTCRSKRKTER